MFFFLPSCHVRIPWSLLLTKARFRWQRVLVCSCNLIRPAPAQSSCTRPSQSAPQHIASLATGGSPAKAHAPFPSQKINSFSKPQQLLHQIIHSISGSLPESLFLSSLSGRKAFQAHHLDKAAFKSLLATSVKPYLTKVNSPTQADWQDSQMLLGGMGRGGRQVSKSKKRVFFYLLGSC